MKPIDPRQKVAILRVMRDAGKAIGSTVIAEAVAAHGFHPSDRSIRLYLHEMEEEGLVTTASRGLKGGREITAEGLEEIQSALVTERVGLAAARVDTLAWRMTFSPTSRKGRVVLNVSVLDAEHLSRALFEMQSVFAAGLGMGEYLVLAEAGERIGEFVVPEGKVAIGTVCSVTVNGSLLRAHIPMVSTFAGVLEINDGRPERFTDVIHYDGTSLDPLEIFIKSGLTSVREAARTGRGRIGASFREIPTDALPQATRVLKRLERLKLGAVLAIGEPDSPLLDFPVPEGRTGMIVAGGLNPLAAVEETGIGTRNKAMSTFYEFSCLQHFEEVCKER